MIRPRELRSEVLEFVELFAHPKLHVDQPQESCSPPRGVVMVDVVPMVPEASALQELRSGELHIDTRADPECLHLVWHGRSAAKDPREVLVPYFEQAIEVARRCGIPVEMHFEGLAYFNSSTIAALIDAIRIGSERRVPMVMIYKRDVRWQRVSFDALRMFTQDHDFELRTV